MSKQSNKYYVDGYTVNGPNFSHQADTQEEAEAFKRRMNKLVEIAETNQRLAQIMTTAAEQLRLQLLEADNSGEEWKDGGK